MRKRINNKYLFIFSAAILLCIFFIAYAQINNIDLFINGTASAPGIKSSEDFDVKFTDAIIGEQMSVEDLVKGVSIASGNDAVVIKKQSQVIEGKITI